jgi:hypothetical protein
MLDLFCCGEESSESNLKYQFGVRYMHNEEEKGVMSAKNDWKVIGRFIAVLVQLYTVISNTFKKAGVGIEMLEWLVGSGKAFFVEKLAELACEYKRQNPAPEKNLTRLTVDLDATPFIPDGWSVEEHKKGGVIEWNSAMVALHLDEGQKNEGCVVGNVLHKNLSKLATYNANLLDFLLKKENQHLIPEEWKGKVVSFWGTIYRRSGGRLCVRYLYWSGGAWGWGCRWLVFDWFGRSPAAVSASQN